MSILFRKSHFFEQLYLTKFVFRLHKLSLITNFLYETEFLCSDGFGQLVFNVMWRQSGDPNKAWWRFFKYPVGDKVGKR
jgi:hypothetical protein